MLTGAARAAKTAGVHRLERVWVVAVPVVVALVVERVLTFFFVYWSLLYLHPYAQLVGRGNPWSLRTALVVTSFAVAAYALLWAVVAVVEYAREVRRQGRRLFLRGGVVGRLVVLGSLFLALVWETTVVTSLPTARDVMAMARADFGARYPNRFIGAVLFDVPGIRAFCRENLDHPSRPDRLRAAMALTRLGEESDRVVEILRSISKDEYLDPRNQELFYTLEQIAISDGFSFHLRLRTHITEEMQEEYWQRFRRECIP